MPIDLYYIIGASSCHSVLLTLNALGLDANLHVFDYEKEEHKTPEYEKINPTKTVPTLVDNGFVLTESRAINRYLVRKYGKNSSLYPEDAQLSSLIDSRLDFDLGALYATSTDYYYPVYYAKGEPVEPLKEKFIKSLGHLDKILASTKFAAGDVITIADFSLVSTISGLAAFKFFDITGYPNVNKWLNLVKTTAVGYDEAVEKGNDAIRAYLASTK